jgi:cytochrome c-type biogenesis protein CcmH
MKPRIWIYVLLLLPVLLFVASGAAAQDTTPRIPTDDEVNAIAKQMYCPVCENTPLDVCPTQACAEWRELIRDKLAEGWTEDQIKTYFVEQFGARVLATPPAQGLNWLVYVIPPLAFLAGVFILYRAFMAWRKSGPENVPVVTGKNEDEYVNRIEEELRKHQV